MDSLQVALLQLLPHGEDQSANQAKGEEACRRAANLGADVALFPEMWNVGYSLEEPGPSAAERLERLAISTDSPFVRHFQALAGKLGIAIAIAITYLEQWPGAPRNTVALIDRNGEIAMTYSKVHTCDFSREALLTPGDAFHVANLDTANGDVHVGAMICYDREYPESARVLMLEGAGIILTPNACALNAPQNEQFRVRAHENLVGVAMASYPAPKNNGHSVAFDPMTYPDIDGPPRDTLVVEADDSEGIFMANFNVNLIRAYRERETLGNAYRKPRAYGRLTDSDVAPPFIRPDDRR